MSENIYTRNGYDNRRDYLQCLADDYGISVDIVFEMAAILGPNEDFDGLVSEIQDYEFLFDGKEE